MTINEQLTTYLERDDFEGLRQWLGRLSNSDFRRVERIVREDIMPSLDNERFWEVFRFFAVYRPQAFLPCIASIRHLSDNGTLNFENDDVRKIAKELPESGISKIVGMALPHLNDENQIEGLFKAFHFNDPFKCVSALIKQDSSLAYYILFKILKHNSDKRDLCVKTCQFMMKKNNDISFNMASILREYFGLQEVKGQFSLKVEHFELNYIDKSFDTFKYVLEGRKPRI